MFQVPNSAIVAWHKRANNVFAPTSIDIGCPYCLRRPVNFSFPNWEVRNDSLFGPARCPACSKVANFWVVEYSHESKEEAAVDGVVYMLPAPPLDIPFDDRVKEISPSFIKVYGQATQAEMLELDTIVGIGYRKALEFLVKDWASREHPDDIEKIQGMTLANCIQQYADDARVKEVANRAAWLGNDETHYVRKWTDHDVSDLKVLLRLTLYWISSSLITEEYISNMPKPSKKQQEGA